MGPSKFHMCPNIDSVLVIDDNLYIRGLYMASSGAPFHTRCERKENVDICVSLV
jgi:hypothetical protein